MIGPRRALADRGGRRSRAPGPARRRCPRGTPRRRGTARLGRGRARPARSRGRAAICMIDLRLMPSRMPAVCGGVRMTAVAHDEDVLAGALAHEAAAVEQDRLLVAGLDGLDLGQDAVEVLPGGLGVRDQRVRGDAPPARHLGADAARGRVRAEVGAPRPHGDRHARPRSRAGSGPSGRSRGRRSGGCSTRAARWRRSARGWRCAAPRACTGSACSRAPPTRTAA